MHRLILLKVVLIVYFHVQETMAVKDLYGDTPDRKLAHSGTKLGKNDQFVDIYDRSSTFMQSRRFRADHSRLLSPSQTEKHRSSSRQYTGISPMFVGSNQEGCRLTNNLCSQDYHCCSGKCRCVRWSVMGKMSCWKKCF